MKYLLLIIMMVGTAQTKADAFLVTFGSYHFARNTALNDETYGIGYEYTLDNNSYFTTGGFKNSFNKNSIYFAYGVTTEIFGLNVGMESGFVYGYKDARVIGYKPNKWQERGLMIAPYVTVSKFKIYYLFDAVALQGRF